MHMYDSCKHCASVPVSNIGSNGALYSLRVPVKQSHSYSTSSSSIVEGFGQQSSYSGIGIFEFIVIYKLRVDAFLDTPDFGVSTRNLQDN